MENINAINNLENKRNLSENLDGKRQESKKAKCQDLPGNRPRDPPSEERSNSDPDEDVSFKRKKNLIGWKMIRKMLFRTR